MSNISKLLTQLVEYQPSEDAIEAYAEKHNLSWGKAEDALIAQHKKDSKPTPTGSIKSCWGCGKDWHGTHDGKREGNSYITKHKGKNMCPPCIEEYDQTH